eukprot:scaffold61688_cov36-Phaeocystis_antarctica.AAC.3
MSLLSCRRAISMEKSASYLVSAGALSAGATLWWRPPARRSTAGPDLLCSGAHFRDVVDCGEVRCAIDVAGRGRAAVHCVKQLHHLRDPCCHERLPPVDARRARPVPSYNLELFSFSFLALRCPGKPSRPPNNTLNTQSRAQQTHSRSRSLRAHPHRADPPSVMPRAARLGRRSSGGLGSGRRTRKKCRRAA